MVSGSSVDMSPRATDLYVYLQQIRKRTKSLFILCALLSYIIICIQRCAEFDCSLKRTVFSHFFLTNNHVLTPTVGSKLVLSIVRENVRIKAKNVKVTFLI